MTSRCGPTRDRSPKRSGGGHVVVINGALSKNEEKFLRELDASVVRQDLPAFAAELAELL